MIESLYDYFYDYKAEFPNISHAWSGSLEQVYFAEKDDKFYLIYDGRLAIDLAVGASLSREALEHAVSDPEWIRNIDPIYKEEGIIQIIEFDDADERSGYLQKSYVESVKKKIVFERKLP